MFVSQRVKYNYAACFPEGVTTFEMVRRYSCDQIVVKFGSPVCHACDHVV